MTAALLLSTFDIPQAALDMSPAAAFDDDWYKYNLIGGERYAMGQFNVAATSNSYRFDCGSAVTKAADHLIIARADMLKTAGVTNLTLGAGSDGTTFGTSAYNNASFSSVTLNGPRSHDLLVEFTATSPFRWWRNLMSGSSSKFPHSKISFGTALDPIKDPDDYAIERIPARDAIWYSDSGAAYSCRVDEEIYRLTYWWVGLSAATIAAFRTQVIQYAATRPIFLYTPTTGGVHSLLDDKRVIHVQVIPESIEGDFNLTDYQSLKISFDEVLG